MNGVNEVILLKACLVVEIVLSDGERFEVGAFGENGGELRIRTLEDRALIWGLGRELESLYPVKIVAEECIELSSVQLKVEIVNLCCELREYITFLSALQFVIGSTDRTEYRWTQET